MSKFNRKGHRTLMFRKSETDDRLVPVPVKQGSAMERRHNRNIKKLKKERQAAFREYKAKLREQKKKVPASQRANVNWSQMPERYLDK